MSSDNKEGCGIGWLFFDAYDEFSPGCKIHDAE